jgi:hypothetical protein
MKPALRSWREIAAEQLHTAKPVTPAVTARTVADVAAELKTELQSVRMAGRVRATVEALLNEINERTTT